MRLTIEPPTSFYDEPFAIRISEAPEGDTVRIAATLRELDGSVWQSRDEYRVGPNGYIEDPMRVIWSAEAAGKTTEKPTQIVVELSVEDQVATAVRIDPSVKAGIQPDDPEIEGRLYVPPDGGRYPPVLLLGGGEGGYHRRHPALVARHGFAVLSLAYFGYPRQQPLVEVPLERFEYALQWLLARPTPTRRPSPATSSTSATAPGR